MSESMAPSTLSTAVAPRFTAAPAGLVASTVWSLTVTTGGVTSLIVIAIDSRIPWD